MSVLYGYEAGVNLGHWLSQYREKGKAHFDSYITESDFKQIKSWGIDHVRLPVDYPLFYNEQENCFIEDGLKYIDFSVEMCKKYSLNLILDLHHTPGYAFWNKDDKSKNDLFENEEKQKIFINIWKTFAKRYVGEGDNIRFELLNELVSDSTKPWNKLWKQTVKEIEKISPNRKMIIGPNHWNSIIDLKYLDVTDNKNIIYNFHYYLPFLFTHQRATFSPRVAAYHKSVVYPLDTHEHKEYFNNNDTWTMDRYDVVGKKQMYDFFEDAIEFKNKNNIELYCSEFGVIKNADIQSTIRWLNDTIDIFNDYDIGHSVWSYSGFSDITDKLRNPVNAEIIKAISRKRK